ncbi:MAG: MerR family transcriptional regulator [Roseivirga sp.]
MNDVSNTTSPTQTSSDGYKKYHAIGEVAQLLQVSTSLIRFWEKEFSSLKPKKNQQGTRKYTSADIATLQRIYHLVKEQGYTLQGAKAALKRNDNKPLSNLEIIHALKNMRELLVALKKELQNSGRA